MNLEELRKLDPFGAFNDFVPMSTALSMLMPEYYKDVFRTECECGSEIIISKGLTRYLCCNPRCPIKVAHSLNYVFKSFSAKNVGLETCKDLVRWYNEGIARDRAAGKEVYSIGSHLEILNIPDEYVSEMGQAAYLNFHNAVDKVKSVPMTFPVMVSKIGIPGFDSNAIEALKDIGSATILADEMEKAGGVQNFLTGRRFYDPMKVFYLTRFLQDIVYAQIFVFKNLLPLGQIEIPVVVTGRIKYDGAPISEVDYIQYCNTIGVKNGVRAFDIKNTAAIESVQFVIADVVDTRRKYVRAKEREDEEGRKIVYSAQEFVDYLKGVVACAEQQMNRA